MSSKKEQSCSTPVRTVMDVVRPCGRPVLTGLSTCSYHSEPEEVELLVEKMVGILRRVANSRQTNCDGAHTLECDCVGEAVRTFLDTPAKKEDQ